MPFPPLVAPAGDLSAAERARYARHTRLAELGEVGQQRLKAARVLIVGAGGLGSPSATYLAAAGVGTIGIIDDDVVELSNLHRQPLHSDPDLGRPKVHSAADRLALVNPHVQVQIHRQRLSGESAQEVVAAYDLVVDGADNFATRYLVTDACALAGIPHVWASINTFAGQLSVWWAGRGPCYRCVFPQPPPPGSVASCAEAGVLGALPGVLGTLQASEAIKLITGIGEPAVGRLVLHDALAGSWDEVLVRARADCALCGSAPTITEVREVAAGLGAGPVPLVGVEEAAELVGGRGVRVVDVREAGEFVEGRIEGSVHLPLRELLSGAAEEQLARWRESGDRVIVYCRAGGRSAQAVEYLLGEGVERAESLDGGIVAWLTRED
ncbi:MAG: molybdopterin-synthase adenylyltransferase MoeB [Actinomycetia bacterium]|nr:molybdopterin-synthase adenylyltransferase MoeB [Actinomycetes bacterium]